MTSLPMSTFRDLVDDLEESVFITDADGIILHINQWAASHILSPGTAVIGRSLARLLPDDFTILLRNEGQMALSTGQNRQLKRQHISLPSRGVMIVEVRIIPYRRSSGDSWVVFFLRDITPSERREMIDEGEWKNNETRVRRTFLARMSHEIRTPMNGILGMTELALQSEHSEEIGDYLDVIKGACESLMGIVNDILDFTKVESEQVALEQKPLRPADLLEKTLALLRPTSEEKGTLLSSNVDGKMPAVLIGDPTRLRQIITNLVGNAIKFTEFGRIHVYLSSRKEGEKFFLEGSVTDTGIGIPQNNPENLFRPFVQGDNAVTRGIGGSGLGLAICRSLARQMGGDVEADSTPKGGAIFRFHLQMKMMKNQQALSVVGGGQRRSVKESPPQWEGETILLAEDNRINRMVAEKLLQQVGLRVLSCVDGNEALVAWWDESPDLILMDLQMPNMDGIETSRQIREMEQQSQKAPVPIIALTAHILDDDQRAAEEAGMNGWLTKPVHPTDLYAELERLLPPSRSRNVSL